MDFQVIDCSNSHKLVGWVGTGTSTFPALVSQSISALSVETERNRAYVLYIIIYTLHISNTQNADEDLPECETGG